MRWEGRREGLRAVLFIKKIDLKRIEKLKGFFFLITKWKKKSYYLPHLPSGWHVDQAILNEKERVVVIRFGHDWVSCLFKRKWDKSWALEQSRLFYCSPLNLAIYKSTSVYFTHLLINNYEFENLSNYLFLLQGPNMYEDGWDLIPYSREG